MQVATSQELKQAVKQGEPEIVIVDDAVARRVRMWFVLRRVANVVVFVILGLAIIVWANPLDFDFLRLPGVRLARQIALGVGILLLFADYLMPVVRGYNIAGGDQPGLRLVSRKKK